MTIDGRGPYRLPVLLLVDYVRLSRAIICKDPVSQDRLELAGVGPIRLLSVTKATQLLSLVMAGRVKKSDYDKPSHGGLWSWGVAATASLGF